MAAQEMMAAVLPSVSLRRLLSLAVAMLLLLGAVACDEFDTPAQTVRQDVQGAYGVDTHDSNQVGGAIASGETLGNKEASDGLTVLRAAKRAEHERRGDDLLNLSKAEGVHEGTFERPWVDQAIDEYKAALEWNKPPPPKEAGIIARIGSAFDSALGKGDPAASALLHRKLARAYEAKRDTSPSLFGNDEAARKDAHLAEAREWERAAQAAPDASRRDSFLKSADFARRMARGIENP